MEHAKEEEGEELKRDFFTTLSEDATIYLVWVCVCFFVPKRVFGPYEMMMMMMMIIHQFSSSKMICTDHIAIFHHSWC